MEGSWLLPAGRRRGRDVWGVGRLVVEGDVAVDVESGRQLAAVLGGRGEDVLTLTSDVAALVAGLDHRLDRHPVGRGAGGDAHGVADGAAAELQDDVLAQVIEELVHLARVDAPRGHWH